MKSEKIKQLLTSLKGLSLTDSHAMAILQDIRSEAMATKGGVQRLVKLGCVPCVLKLLYHYTSQDKTDSKKEKVANESRLSVALSIVANLLMEKVARQQVKRDGVETLVMLLTDCSNEEVHIRCCRSLGNLAMEAPARPVLAQANGVPALVKILEIQYLEEESTQAAGQSVAPSTSSDTEDVETEITVKYPSTALVEAACRVLRYVSEDSAVRQQLVEAGVVAPLAMLLKSQEEKLTACVLRTLSQLWTKMNKRITERMASEVCRAGIMARLMELVDCDDDHVSQHAVTVLLPLAAHPHAAALMGASDGVAFLFSRLDSPRQHLGRAHLTSALCHLSREAVNRVKMRGVGALGVLVATLGNGDLEQVHDRVLSALLNFLYDDQSLKVMLHHGLVTALLAHLQRCGGFSAPHPLHLLHHAQQLLPTPHTHLSSADSKSRAHEGIPSGADSQEIMSAADSEAGGDKEILTHMDSKHILSGVDRSLKIDASVTSLSHAGLPDVGALCHSADPFLNKESGCTQTGHVCGEETFVTGEVKLLDDASEIATITSTEFDSAVPVVLRLTEETGGWKEEGSSLDSVSGPLYSMNSPTYLAETGWRMEDYHPGVTRKSYGHPASPASLSALGQDSPQPYSPLSVMSYHSPGHQSPPHSSPVSSYATLSPAHSLGHLEVTSPFSAPSPPSSAGLELLSPLSPSPSPEWDKESSSPSSVNHLADERLVFSSSETDEDDDNDKETTGSIAVQTTPSVDVCVKPPQETKTTHFPTESFLCCPLGVTDQDTSHGAKSLRMQDFEVFSTASGFAGQPQSGTVYQEPEVRQDSSERFFFSWQAKNGKVPKGDSVQKGRKCHGGAAGPYAHRSQSNILVVLSRLSVCAELSTHLATSTVLTCLTHHLAAAAWPQERCARTLSRIMSSPHCLKALLTMCAPAIVVRALMLDSGFVLLSGVVEGKAGSCSRDRRSLSLTEFNMRSLMRMSAEGTGPSCTPLQTDQPFRSTSKHRHVSLSKLAVKTTNKRSCDKAEVTEEDSRKKCVQHLARTGRQLLGDLSNQAMSPYGEGVILYTFSCLSASHQLLHATSLLFLQAAWSQERRQKYLLQIGAVERVLSALQAPQRHSHALKDVLVLGLVFLAHTLPPPLRFQTSDLQRFLLTAVNSVSDVSENPACTTDDILVSHHRIAEVGEEARSTDVCRYARAKKDLQIMVGEGGSAEVLVARRETLVRNSSVFAAMLRGSYIESTQSKVSVSDVSPPAMTLMLHFLHGCGEECQLLTSLNKPSDGETAFEESGQNETLSTKLTLNFQPRGLSAGSKEQLRLVLDAITLADRFLLPDVLCYLCAVASTSWLDLTSAGEVLHFALFHGLLELAEDALLCLLLSPQPMSSIASGLISLAESHCGPQLAAVALTLFKRGVTSTA